MEPFGLFDFLQNLLNAQAPAGESAPPPEPQKTEAPATAERPAPQTKNPAAAFLEAHERRAGRG